MTEKIPQQTQRIIDGIPYILSPAGRCWIPDYNVPGVREAIDRRVDLTIAEHWHIDRHRD